MIINLAEITWTENKNKSITLGPIPKECHGTFSTEQEQATASFSDENSWLKSDFLPNPENDGVAERHFRRTAHLREVAA